MSASIQKTVIIAISVAVALFLLFDGGSITATTVSGDMAITNLLIAHTWIWMVPTLLIFGLGFLLAWIILERDAAPQQMHNALSEEKRGGAIQSNACYWERIDDPRHASLEQGLQ